MALTFKSLRLAAHILGALAISLVLWELLLRAVVIRPFKVANVPGLGSMPRPHSTGLWTIEGRGLLRFNELGLHDDPVAAKGPGEFRILACGDSQTEGYQMALAQTFPRRVQVLLNKQTPGLGGYTSFRVINAGHNDTAPGYFVGLANAHKRIFRPDWMVLQTSDADWPELFKGGTGQEVYLEVKANSFAIHYAWHRDHRSRLRSLAALFGLDDFAITTYARERAFFMAQGDAQANERLIQRKSKLTPQIAAAMKWTLKRLMAAYPHRLVIMHLPSLSPATLGLMPPTAVEKELIRQCATLRIPLVSMRAPITTDYASTGIPPFGFANTMPWRGHPNSHLDDMIAHKLLAFFQQALAPRTGVPSRPIGQQML